MNAADDDDDSFVDDNDLEVMFADEEDSDRRKQKKSKENPDQVDLPRCFCDQKSFSILSEDCYTIKSSKISLV